MIFDVFMWSVNKFRPREGWLSFGLLVLIVSLAVTAVLEVNWVPEVEVVVITAVFGLLIAYLLAKRAKSTRFAWLLLILYGLLITTIRLANLMPPWHIFRQGYWPLRDYWLRNSAIFLDRSASWIVAVAAGNRSQETIGFAFGLGIVSWLLVAFAVWTTIRLQKPYLGMTILGIGVALNGFFGIVPIWYLAFFIGLAILLSSTIYYISLEQKWMSRGLDFSPEIRFDTLIYTAAISATLLFASMSLPAVSIPKMVEAFMNHPWVVGAEEALDDAFGGVDSPRPTPRNPGSIGGRGVLPRSYLLNEIPDLTEIIVMEAKVTLDNGDIAPSSVLKRAHWRGLSYETYTGRGWTLSKEREEPLSANQSVPLPAAKGTINVIQEVEWVRDNRLVRYTLGQPLEFDHDVILRWRGLDDLVRVQGEETSFKTTTRISIAQPDELRATSMADVPPVIHYRYTQLPASLSERITEMAQDVAGGYDNPYDQARALEQFLRQYPYSLEIEPPPPSVDPVEYFLFDVQSGYCDYYATSMVVMARSLGIPARMAVGFLSQDPDENGVQTIRQINGHSWPEIYFPGYGWVEFEPTAAFSSPHDTPFSMELDPAMAEWYREQYGQTQDSVPLPDRDPVKEPVNWGKILTRVGLVMVFVLVFAAVWFWLQNRPTSGDGVIDAYGRLQAQAKKLNQPVPPQQTPAEFNTAFQENLEGLTTQSQPHSRVREVTPLAARLSTLFEERQYAHEPEDHTDEAKTLWKKMKRPLWYLRLRKAISKNKMSK